MCVGSVQCVVVECVIVKDGVEGSGEGYDFAFVWSKFHLPGLFPLLKGVQVNLEKSAVVRGLNRSEEEAVVSKESSVGVRGEEGLRKIIYK